jgi:mRNA interferase MazF
MLTSGDVAHVDLGLPSGREAGFRHRAVIVTAQRILDAGPNVVQVVPLTTTIRSFASEVHLEADAENGLAHRSAAQCHQIRAVSTARIVRVQGNVGSATLSQIRQILGLILDIS